MGDKKYYKDALQKLGGDVKKSAVSKPPKLT